MKKHISKHVAAFAARISLLSIFAALLLSLLVPVHAAAQDGPGKPRVSVQHAESIDGLPVFDVFIEKPGEEPLDLSITDEAGVILYTSRIRSANFNKRFQVEIPGENTVKLILKLDNRKSGESQTYLINSRVTLVQDMVVSRL